MTACSAIDVRVEAYGRETLPENERRELRTHLAACPACRERALAADPAIVFAVPAPAAADDAGRRIADETEARFVLENVKAALAVRAASQKLDRSPSIRHGRRAASGLAAAALVALALSGSGRPRRAEIASARSSVSSGLRGATKIVRPGADESPSMPSSATIYEWNPGTASPEDPKIVWIVDRSLDL